MPSIREYAQQAEKKTTIRQFAETEGDVDLGRIQDKERAFRATQLRLSKYQPRPDVDIAVQRELVKADRAEEIEGLAPKRKLLDPLFAGVSDVIGGFGQTLSYIGAKIPGEGAFDKTGEKLQEYAGAASKELTDIEAVSELGEFDFADMKNPEWWKNTVMRQLPQFASFIATGILGGGAVSVATKGLKLAPYASKMLNVLGGSTAATALESALEAGQVFDEAMDKFSDEEVATKAANKAFIQNASLLSGTNFAEFLLAMTPARKIPFFSSSKLLRTGAKVAVSGAMEATEEMLQAKFQTEALGEEFRFTSPEAKEAGAIGALFGGTLGGVGEVYNTFRDTTIKNLPKELKAEFDKQVKIESDKGASPDVSQNKALDTMTEKNPKGVEQAIDGAVQEMSKDDPQFQKEIKIKEVEEAKISEKIKPQEVPVAVKIEKPTVSTPEGREKAALLPVESEGKIKKSRFFQRVNEKLKFAEEDLEPEFRSLDSEKDTMKAIKFVQSNPTVAIDVAKGIKSAPAGIRQNAIAIAVSEKLEQEGKIKEKIDVLSATTLRATRQGQEIEALKHISKDSSDFFISQVLKDRTEQADIGTIKYVKDKKTGKTITRAKAVSDKISSDAKEATKQINKKTADLTSAQNIINSIIC